MQRSFTSPPCFAHPASWPTPGRSPRPTSFSSLRSATFTALCLIVSAVIVGLPPSVSATERGEARQDFGDEIEVTEVLIDVVAVDRKGEVIGGLGIDDFSILEDGEPVEATSASFYRTAYGPSDPSTGGPEAEIPASRYFVLFFHDPRTRHAQPLHAFPTLLRQFLRAGEQSRSWLLDGLQPSDWGAVVRFGPHGLQVVQDFTQDRVRLAAAAETATVDTRLPRPSERPRPPRPGEPALRRLLDREPTTPRRQGIEHALARVADASAHIIGRKNLLLFTPGIAPLTARGGGATKHASQQDLLHVSDHPVPALDQALNASNIAVYVLDLGGPRPAQIEAEIAVRSGGAFLPGLRFRHALDQIATESRGYYLLSYRPAAGRDGSRDRTIEVRARDHRITVRARRGLRLPPQ